MSGKTEFTMECVNDMMSEARGILADLKVVIAQIEPLVDAANLVRGISPEVAAGLLREAASHVTTVQRAHRAMERIRACVT